MKPVPGFPDQPPPGLTTTIEDAGIDLRNQGGIWVASDPDAAAAIVKAYDPLPHVIAEKEAALAGARWEKETGGFLFQPSGADRPHLFISTREAMGPVMGAVLAVQVGVFPDPTMWKTAEGDFVQITRDDVLPLFKAFAAHVAAAFSEEAQKQDAARKETDWAAVAAIAIDPLAVP